jgi:hypothetical protein
MIVPLLRGEADYPTGDVFTLVPTLLAGLVFLPALCGPALPPTLGTYFASSSCSIDNARPQAYHSHEPGS